MARQFRNTKQAINEQGHLYALYLFRVYKKNKQPKDYTIDGNATSSNVSRDKNRMFRQAFKDARYKLFYIIGGSYKYISKLLQYTFAYDKRIDNIMTKRGSKHNINYYNEQIPETERKHLILKSERKNKIKNAKKGIKIIRGVKNDKSKRNNNYKRKKTNTKRNTKLTKRYRKIQSKNKKNKQPRNYGNNSRKKDNKRTEARNIKLKTRNFKKAKQILRGR